MLFNRLFRSAKSHPSSAPLARPATRLSVEARDDRIAPAALSAGDAAIVEGNAGIQYALVSPGYRCYGGLRPRAELAPRN
jgi:hypothetical protein